jgi:hypothetical protein
VALTVQSEERSFEVGPRRVVLPIIGRVVLHPRGRCPSVVVFLNHTLIFWCNTRIR